MRTRVSKFQIYRESAKDQKLWGNYADENILLKTHQKVSPVMDLTEPVMDYLAETSPGLNAGKTPLWDMLKKAGKKREIESDRVSWKLKAKGNTLARQVENTIPSVEKPGVQHETFPILLDDPTFVPGDVLAPYSAMDVEVVVQQLPQTQGTKRNIYTVQLADKRPTAYFPPELLKQGLRWKKTGASYGEASSQYGSTKFQGTSYVKFYSELSDWGKSVEVTNKAHDLNLKMHMCDRNGEKLDQEYPPQIISYIEAEFMAQAKEEKESMLFRGRSAGKNIIDNSSGKHRRKGPGVMEFLADGNVIPYTQGSFSTRMFGDVLQSLWFDRVKYGDRNVVGLAGQGALTLWRDALKKEYNVEPTFRDHKDFTKSAKSYDPKNYDGFKINTNQPTATAMYPWGSIEMTHFPPLDDMEYNGGNLHPETGLPLSSYDIIFLDWGLGNGFDSNIELLHRKNSEVYTYNCGVWSPGGAIGKSNTTFTSTGPHRSYELLAADTFGTRVKDVSLTAWFTMAVN